MNDRQRSRFNMLKNVLKWLSINMSRLIGIPDMEESFAELESRVKAIDLLSPKTTDTSAGATEEKRDAREKLIEVTMKLAAQLRLFASRVNLISLLNEVSWVKTDLVRSSAQHLQDQAEFILEKANGVKDHEQAAKYKVTVELITPVAEALIWYKETVTGPRQKVVSRSTSNELLNNQLDDTVDFVDNTIDLQLDTIETDEPELYLSYQNARKIID